MRKQFSKAQHQSVHKGKHQVDCGTSQDTPECWGLVKEHRRGGRRVNRRYQLVWRRVVFRVRWDGQAGLVELLGAGVGVGCHDAGGIDQGKWEGRVEMRRVGNFEDDAVFNKISGFQIDSSNVELRYGCLAVEVVQRRCWLVLICGTVWRYVSRCCSWQIR